MSAQAVELALARLYTEADLRERYLREPAAVLAQFDLTSAERESLLRMDRAGLVLAARSYAHKREQRIRRGSGWQPILGKIGRSLAQVLQRASRHK